MRGIFDIDGDRPAHRIQQALYKAAEKRHELPVEEWIEAELKVMLDVTNEERKKLGKGPIDIEKVRVEDRCASGHIDYSLKVALGCERLVYED